MKKIIVFIAIIILTAVATSSVISVIKNRNSKNNSSPSTESPKTQDSNPELERKTIDAYRIPILMYHYIRDFDDPNDQIGTNLSVSPSTFDKQLSWLKDNGYQSVNPDYLLNPYALEHKPIILTFDDGYNDAYTNAFPILKKDGFIATFYLITNYIENSNPDYLTWDQAKEMKRANMNIGSHTLTHPDLAKSTDAQMDKEVSESKKILESTIGGATSDFCYPSGKYDTRTITTLKKYGYKTAVTVKSGIANQESNLFELPRIRMTNNTNLSSVLEK